MSKDISISPVMNIPQGSVISQKPCYLIKFNSENKKTGKLFIAVEQPNLQLSYIHVKGFFYEGDEDVLYNEYSDIVVKTEKSTYVEMWIPWHSINVVRSLVFKGDKNKK